MTTKIYSQRGKLALVAGLTWHPLSSKKKDRPKEIRRLAAEAEANRVVIAAGSQADDADSAAVGLYQTMVSFEEDPGDLPTHDGKKAVPAKVLHSVAAAFAAQVNAPNAVLVLMPDLVGHPDQACVVVISNGLIRTDDVKPPEEAKAIAMNLVLGDQGFIYTLHTNARDEFDCESTSIDEEQLWAGVSKSTLLVPKPANITAYVTVVVVLALIAGGIYGFMQYKEEQDRKERARKAALANPTPKYLAALSTQMRQLGMNRAAAQALLARIGTQPVWMKGWTLSKIECKVGSGECMSSWTRQGGTTDELVAARAPLGEQIAGASTVDKAIFTFKVDMPASGIESRDELPLAADAVIASTPIQQIWSNAGVNSTVASDGFKPWPNVPGIDMKKVKPEVTVKARLMKIDTDSALAKEVLSTAPNNVWWTSVGFNVTLGGTAVDSLKAHLEGNAYVR